MSIITTSVNTRDGYTNLPSLLLGSLQAINCKFQTIRNVSFAYIDTVISRVVTGLDPPINGTDAANKDYVDSKTANAAGPDTSIQFNANNNFAGSSNLTWTTGTNTLFVNGYVSGLLSPVTSSDAVNKAYVDGLIAGSLPSAPVGSIQFNGGPNVPFGPDVFEGTSSLSWITASNTLNVSGNIVSINPNTLNVSISNSINTFINDTNSFVPTNGAVVITGGLGIGKNVNIGGDLDVDQDANIVGNAYANKFLATSDVNYKENIYPLDNSLDKLRKMECYRYNLKPQYTKQKDITEDYGLIAQQLEKIGLENLVDNSLGHKTVNYIQIIAMLINCVQELDRKVAIQNFNKMYSEALEQNISEILDSLKEQKVRQLQKEIEEEIQIKTKTQISLLLNEVTNNINNLVLLQKKDIEEIKEEILLLKPVIYNHSKILQTNNVDLIEQSELLEELSQKTSKIKNNMDHVVDTVILNCKTKIEDLALEYESVIVENNHRETYKKNRKRLSRHE